MEYGDWIVSSEAYKLSMLPWSISGVMSLPSIANVKTLKECIKRIV